MNENRLQNHPWLVLTCLLVLGGLLRLWVATTADFFEEEIGLVASASRPWSLVAPVLDDRGEPYAAVWLFGCCALVADRLGVHHIAVLRMLPLVCSVLTIAVGYLWLRRLHGTAVAVIGVGLLAALPSIVRAGSLATAAPVVQLAIIVTAFSVYEAMLRPSASLLRLVPLFGLAWLVANLIEPASGLFLLSLILCVPIIMRACMRPGRVLLFVATAVLVSIAVRFGFYPETSGAGIASPTDVVQHLVRWLLRRPVSASLNGWPVLLVVWTLLSVVAMPGMPRAGWRWFRCLTMPIIGVALLMLLAGHGDFYHQWRLNWLEPVWAVGLAIAWGTRRKRPGLWQWGVMLVSACAAAWSQSEFRLQRPAHHVFRYLSAYAQPMAGDIVTWTDPWTARFLNRSGDVQLLGPEAFLEWVALHPAGAPPGTGIYVISHAAASPPKQSTDAAGSLLEYLVGRTPGVVAYPIERDWGEWKQIWRVMPDVCPAIAEQHALGMRQIEEMRQVEGAEQVLLASDLPFDSGGSFGQLEWTGDLRPQRWTLDNAPSLRWRAPERTGRYLLRVEGMRHHPLPTEVSLLRYRLPGAREWREMPMAVGPVEFEGEIEVTKPGEWLELQLELISWQPWFYISGSTDARALGIILSRVSLIPLDR